MNAKISMTAMVAVAMAVMVLTTGCLRSRVHFSSEPVEAEVYVNDEPRGKTPFVMPFTWYWYYDVRVEKDGYQPIETVESFRSPWWACFPLDLVVEAMPFPVYDSRYRHYSLEPLEAGEAPSE